jgi:hypothetical protein
MFWKGFLHILYMYIVVNIIIVKSFEVLRKEEEWGIAESFTKGPNNGSY